MFSIYHQKAGASGWNLKSNFPTKNQATNELKRWAILDSERTEDEDLIESLNLVTESYDYDQDYYRVVLSVSDYLENADCNDKYWKT